jgi:hypothetical protein
MKWESSALSTNQHQLKKNSIEFNNDVPSLCLLFIKRTAFSLCCYDYGSLIHFESLQGSQKSNARNDRLSTNCITERENNKITSTNCN